MKILAIRGKNLASLSGEFEVPFQQEPLVSTGLFAISGPTGAGKSTLLDALCLALYDDTPRMLKAGSSGTQLPDVAGETVTPHDTRTLLRRGATEGYAEVDFVGNDDREYRARWSVRRSRSKANGKLQPVAMTLKRLPELQSIGGINKEVKAEIAQRIGLNFEQFTRSVLLAQNEFSAFLKADDNERGELLETLTGTVIYSAISRRAFERAKVEQTALTRLTERLADKKPLIREAREQLDYQSKQANELKQTLELRKKNLDSHLRWYEALSKSQHSEHLAIQEWDKFFAEQQAAVPRLKNFERIEAVQTARPLLNNCERIKAEIAETQLTLDKNNLELAKTTLAVEAAIKVHDMARLALLEAEQRQWVAVPELDQAKALDTQLDTLIPLHHQAKQMQEEANTAEILVQQALDSNSQKRILVQKEQDKAKDWLAQHDCLKILADSWPRWDMLFNQATQLSQEIVKFTKLSVAAQQNEIRLSQAEVAANSHLHAAAHAMNLADTKRIELQEYLGRFDVPARLLLKQSTDLRRDHLLSAEQLWRELEGNLSSKLLMDNEVRQLQEAISQAESALGQLADPIKSNNAALAQAERSLKTAEAACARNVETLREALEENEACPVCGALDHPYRSENLQLHAMLDSLQVEVTICRKQLQQLLHEQTSYSTEIMGKRTQLATLTQKLLKLDASIEIGKRAWETHALAHELNNIDISERARWFDGQQQTIRGQLQAIIEEEKTERDATLARDKAQAEFDKSIQQHTACKDAVMTAQASLAKARSDNSASSEKLTDFELRQKATLAELDTAFENQDWMESWHVAPETFHAERKREVGQWQAQSKVLEKCQLQLVQLDTSHTALLEALARAEAATGRATAEFTISSANIKKLQDARSTLFGGKATQLIQAEFSEAIASAKRKLAEQVVLTQHCTNAKIRHEEACNQACKLLAEQQSAADTTAAELTVWLNQFNSSNPASPLDLDQLRFLLSHPSEWISGERKQLQAIDRAVETAKAVLQERQTLREKHEQNRPTTETEEVVKEALNRLEAEQQNAQSEATRLLLDIARDEEHRKQSASMMEEIEKQEAVHRLWAQLSELIGSADGKKFRNYAQQFTLDVLLGYANKHLTELSRRYRLQRVHNTLALMVIDLDMGDELRSVHSLSGGESFLVSLALALGLASLSSNRVRVESLFIDEGFGSLDPETLSIAMDALDGLQAMGRKVGVISHVQEMTERISTRIQVQRLAGGKSQVVIA